MSAEVLARIEKPTVERGLETSETLPTWLGMAVTIIMPVEGPQEAIPIFAEHIAGDLYEPIGHDDETVWKSCGRVRCRQGSAGGIEGLVAVEKGD